MRRPVLALAATLTALVAGALAPAQAITNGELDEDHPYVGLVAAEMPHGAPPAVCSGAFLDAHTFLTAGHCFDGREESGWVEIRQGEGPLRSWVDPVGEVESVHLHPLYDPTDFSAHDLAVVELDKDGTGAAAPYATLPEVNQLDQLRPSVKTTFTAVGYGLTRASTPQAGRALSPFTRMAAHPRLLKINHKQTGEGSFLVSANTKTGGTCSGDSGGPVLLEGTDVVAGVVSYGKNALCAGQSGIYRVDRADDLAFLDRFVG